jgi:hypothetical protein
MVKDISRFSAFLILAFSIVSTAQTVNITGSVKRANGSPIKGATVWLAKAKTFTTTNENGTFTLAGQVAQISTLRRDFTNNVPQLINNRLYFNVESPSADLQVDVFNLSGRQVASILKQRVGLGRYSLAIAPASLSAGLYCIRLKVGPTVSYFKTPIAQRQNDRPIKLTGVSRTSMPPSYLTKQVAVVDSIVAGCADCVPSSQAIETYSGTYSFNLGNAPYTPPAFIKNSSCEWVYRVSLTNQYMYDEVSDLKGSTSLSLRNFVWLGDSVRYSVVTIDSSTVTSTQTGEHVKKAGTSIRNYTDPANCSPLSLLKSACYYPDRVRATYNGTPISIINYGFCDKDYIFSDEIGQILFSEIASVTFSDQQLATEYCPLFTLIRLNQVPFDTSNIIYLKNPASFRSDKDTTGGFVGSTIIYTLTYIFNPDNASITYSLLQKPAGMTIHNDTLRWTPGSQNTGPNTISVKLLDSRGYTDTLNLCVYVTTPLLTLDYSIKSYSLTEFATSLTGVSTITIGPIDSSKITPKYLIITSDSSSSFPSPTISTPATIKRVFYSCRLDTAIVRFWTTKYSTLAKPGTLKKAVVNGDTTTVKTVIDSTVINSGRSIKTQNTVSFAESIGLISYDMEGSGVGEPCHGTWSANVNLNRVNGVPLNIVDGL